MNLFLGKLSPSYHYIFSSPLLFVYEVNLTGNPRHQRGWKSDQQPMSWSMEIDACLGALGKRAGQITTNTFRYYEYGIANWLFVEISSGIFFLVIVYQLVCKHDCATKAGETEAIVQLWLYGPKIVLSLASYDNNFLDPDDRYYRQGQKGLFKEFAQWGIRTKFKAHRQQINKDIDRTLH